MSMRVREESFCCARNNDAAVVAVLLQFMESLRQKPNIPVC